VENRWGRLRGSRGGIRFAICRIPDDSIRADGEASGQMFVVEHGKTEQ
jgi:hypothetical protein